LVYIDDRISSRPFPIVFQHWICISRMPAGGGTS
jgi:hypothetical protein